MKGQDFADFHWLIVDDGSTDSTEALVKTFQDAAPFPITYLKQENGGKQRAFNVGVSHCTDELFFCVDSDDTLAPGALSALWSRWLEVRDDPKVAGLIGMDGKDADTPLRTRIPDELDKVTMWDLYYKHGHKGDTALAHRTEILREYPFWVAENEKFIAETYVFHQIDQKYTLGVVHEVLIVVEYREDGYSKNVRKITRDNPQGYAKLKRMYIEYADTLYLKYYNTILYLVGCRLAGKRNAIADAPNKPLAILAYLPAWLLCKTVYR